MNNKKIPITFVCIALLMLSGCSGKNKEESSKVLKKERAEPNVYARAERNAAKNPIIFGNFGKKTENLENKILWKSALETLDFMPLTSVDFTGGMIITDWYSSNKSNEEIKLNIVFNSYEIKTDSFLVKGFKKVCTNQKCEVNPIDTNFANQIKIKILDKARVNNISQK